jgi:hypothetical protein
MGVFPLISIIPCIRLMNVDVEKKGVDSRDPSSWLNYEAENITSTVIDQLMLARLHLV